MLSVVPALCPTASAQGTGVEDPLALVNGIPILPSDLDYAFEAWKFHSKRTSAFDISGTLNRLIAVELLYQESLKHRFPGLIEEAEEKYRREVINVGGEEKLQSTLRCNNMSLEQFRKSIFRNLAINRLLDRQVYSRITVTNREIGKFYEANKHRFQTPESVKLRQIFIKVPPSADTKTLIEVKNRARTIFKLASDGSDFVLLARKHSDDPAGASFGGEMGVIFKGNLHKPFESLVFSLGEGSVTEPIRSPKGYHIFKVVSLPPPATRPLNEVRSKIITEIRKSKARIMISEYVSSLEKNADIRIFHTGSNN